MRRTWYYSCHDRREYRISLSTPTQIMEWENVKNSPHISTFIVNEKINV